MADWTKTRLTLRYHWKTMLFSGVGGLATVTVSVWLIGFPSPARAGLDWPSGCAYWNDELFHHRTTAEHIHYCVTQNRVNVTQTDHEGRTLLHRIARDIARKRKQGWWGGVLDEWHPGTSRAERMKMVRTLLYWKDEWDLDLEAVDHKGRTALHYASKKTKGWPMAALLLKAGASMNVSDSGKEKVRENVVPIIQAAGQRFNNPFTGKVDFDAVFACQTADCLVEEVVQDAE